MNCTEPSSSASAAFYSVPPQPPAPPFRLPARRLDELPPPLLADARPRHGRQHDEVARGPCQREAQRRQPRIRREVQRATRDDAPVRPQLFLRAGDLLERDGKAPPDRQYEVQDVRDRLDGLHD